MRIVRLAPLLVLTACATLGTTSDDTQNLPTTGVGPFRALTTPELRDVAPFVFLGEKAQYREPTIVAVNVADASSTSAVLYAVAASASGDVIVRTHAVDARSFYGSSSDDGATVPVVLQSDAAWEGGSLSGPSALNVGSSVWLYYAAAGGIGLATSTDGVTFQKLAAPVLTPDPSVTWETSTPAAPSVAQYPDGQYRMLYAAGGYLGEATSADGMTWTRLDSDPTTPAIDPVFGPSASVDPATLPTGVKPPFDTSSVGDPCLAPRMTPAGRLQVRVLYTGVAPAGAGGAPVTTIGFAARYGDSGPFVRQSDPVYAVSMGEQAPALFEWSGGSMLYVQQTYSQGSDVYPGIAAAFAPTTETLPAPSAYPASP